MPRNPTIEQLRKLWRSVHALEGQDLVDAIADARKVGLKWEKSSQSLKAKSIGLGVEPRMMIIRERLKQKLGTDNAVYDDLKAHDEHNFLPSKYNLRRALSISDSVELSSKFHKSGAAEVLWKCIGKAVRRSRGANDARLLFSKQFSGPDAVVNFQNWLEDGSAIQDVYLDTPQFPVFFSNQEREAMLRNLSRLLKLSEDTQPVINLHQKGMWQGLRAVVPHIARLRAPDDSRPLIYIPLVSYSNDFTAPSYPEVLSYLDTFLAGHEPTPGSEITRVDPERVIERIRRNMALTPAIIVFGGYSDPTIEFKELERAIADDFLLGLITKLITPPIGHLHSNAELKRFRQNQLIVLSDNPLHFDSGTSRLEVPLPDKSQLRDILNAQGLKNPNEVGRFLNIGAIAESRSEAVLYALDALVSLGRVSQADDENPNALIHEVGAKLPSVKANDIHDPSNRPMRAVVEVFLDRLQSSHKELYWLLLLIASTPGGVRGDTLARLVNAARQVTDLGFKPVSTLHDIQEPDVAISKLKEVCGRILTDRKTDEFNGLERAHRAEFPGDLIASETNPIALPTQAIDYAIPEFRRAVLERVSRWEVKRIQAIHRLLAEESLAQATIAFRHDPDQGTIRSLRRLLGVLYHGFMSLPISKMKFGDATIRSVEFAMPIEPAELWSWLYLFVYRRLIERPPVWRLTRIFGEDALKDEILQIVARPWKLWARYPEAQRFISTAQETLLPDKNHDVGPSAELAFDYYLAKAQASYSMSLLEESKLELLSANQIEPRNIEAKLRVIKREIDVKLLTQSFEQSADIKGEFFDIIGEEAKTAIVEFIAESSREIRRTVGTANFKPATHLPSAAQIVETLAEQSGSRWKPSELSQISDVLFRIGQSYALEGDMKHADWKIKELQQGRRLVSASDIGSAEPFTTCLAYSRLAEALRLKVFAMAPSSSHYFASGHSSRQSTRIALKLERYSSEQMPPGWEPVRGFFARQARKMCDVATRHLYFYPRERASLLTLESTMARLLPSRAIEPDILQSARTFLQAAEPLVLNLGNRTTRLRMRFLLERAKLHRRYAMLEGVTDKDYFLDCAESDLSSLRSMADQKGLPIWLKLQELQSLSLKQARAAT